MPICGVKIFGFLPWTFAANLSGLWWCGGSSGSARPADVEQGSSEKHQERWHQKQITCRFMEITWNYCIYLEFIRICVRILYMYVYVFIYIYNTSKNFPWRFGTNHFFVGDGWVSWIISKQVYDFVERHLWDHLSGHLKPCFLFCRVLSFQDMKVML